LSRLGYEVVLLCARPRLPGRRREDGRDAPDGIPVRFLSPRPLPEWEDPLTTILRKASYLRPGECRHPFGWWLRFYAPEQRLPALLGDIGPSAVVLRSLFLQYLLVIRRVVSCPVVVDCHDDDVHLAWEMVRTVPLWRKAGPMANFVGVRRVVKSLLPLADEVWTVSDEDAGRLRQFAGGRPVLTVPSGVDEGELAPSAAPGRDGICAVVGNFDYGPNLNGARWFVSKVWGLVRRQLPSAELWLVGSDAKDALTELCESHPGVRALGRVPDLTPVYRDAGVMVVPLIEGGGTRLKVVEAWKNGKAVAGTTKGLEGLAAPPDAAAIADDPARLANAIAALLRDVEARRVLGARGLAFVSSRYAWRVIASALRDSSIVGRLQQ
ncbi:MAG: glycosyltransferase, partial [Thermoanaerobaculia bacterium]